MKKVLIGQCAYQVAASILMMAGITLGTYSANHPSNIWAIICDDYGFMLAIIEFSSVGLGVVSLSDKDSAPLGVALLGLAVVFILCALTWFVRWN